MRDFGKVAPTFWTGDTGRQLRALGRDEQLLALFLITAPCSNMIGLYHLPLPVIAHYLGWDEKHVKPAVQRIVETGFCYYDFARELVFIPKMAEHQIDGSLHPRDKRVKFVRHAWEAFRKTPFYRLFHERYHEAFHLPALAEDDQGEQLPLPGLDEMETEETPEVKSVGLPASLDTPAFHAAWQEWLRYRSERRLSKPKGISLQKAWNRLAEWGAERAIAAIQHSISQGWNGIFEAKTSNDSHRNSVGASSRIQSAPDKYAGVGTVLGAEPASAGSTGTLLAPAQEPRAGRDRAGLASAAAATADW